MSGYIDRDDRRQIIEIGSVTQMEQLTTVSVMTNATVHKMSEV